MTKEEYINKMQEDGDWAPGWDAIDAAFKVVYKDQEPKHFATNFEARAMFGGDSYIDGYSIYTSPQNYKHIVTYGMSNLYADEDAYDQEDSGFGYEMTMKLKVDTEEECMWALNVLSNLARYTYEQERIIMPFEFIPANQPIKIGSDTALTGFITVFDTEVAPTSSIHGNVQFVQFVGVTQAEIDALIKDPSLASSLIDKMRSDNPMLVTDLSRTHSYL